MKVFSTHLDHNLIVNMIKMSIKKTTKQKHRHKTTKCLRLFKKFKSSGRRFDG